MGGAHGSFSVVQAYQAAFLCRRISDLQSKDWSHAEKEKLRAKTLPEDSFLDALMMEDDDMTIRPASTQVLF